jgi:plasmid stabilization system protein ParE
MEQPCALSGCGGRWPTWKRANYIAEDDRAAAVRVVQRILRSVELLKKNPAMGRAGRVPGTRELVVGGTPYKWGIVPGIQC